MQRNILHFFILDNIVIISSLVLFLVIIIKKLGFEGWYGKITKKQDILIKLVIGFMIGYMVIKITIPSFLDIPYVINEEYQEATGITEKRNPRGSRSRRLDLVTEDNKEISIEVVNYWPDIQAGSEVVVKYLPNSKYGFIVDVY